jgi:hypothetical protein
MADDDRPALLVAWTTTSYVQPRLLPLIVRVWEETVTFGNGLVTSYRKLALFVKNAPSWRVPLEPTDRLNGAIAVEPTKPGGSAFVGKRINMPLVVLVVGSVKSASPGAPVGESPLTKTGDVLENVPTTVTFANASTKICSPASLPDVPSIDIHEAAAPSALYLITNAAWS